MMCLPCSSHTEAVAVAVDGGGKFVLWPYGAPETEKSTPVSLSRLNSTQKQVVSCVAAIEQWPGMLVAGLESGAVMVLDSRNAVQTKVRWRRFFLRVTSTAHHLMCQSFKLHRYVLLLIDFDAFSDRFWMSFTSGDHTPQRSRALQSHDHQRTRFSSHQELEGTQDQLAVYSV